MDFEEEAQKATKFAKDYCLGQQVAYNNVFSKENQFTKVVLEDLAKFCRADESTFHIDPRAHALLEGRREVYLRIKEHLELSPDEFWKKRKRKVDKDG